MAKKIIRVEDLLKLMDDDCGVHVNFTAYGVHWGNSTDSGTTAEELLKNMRHDCLKAQVFDIHSWNCDDMIIINATLTK